MLYILGCLAYSSGSMYPKSTMYLRIMSQLFLIIYSYFLNDGVLGPLMVSGGADVSHAATLDMQLHKRPCCVADE